MVFSNGRENAAMPSAIIVADTFNPSALFTPRYSSSFTMGEPANAKTALVFWKNWDDNQLDKSFSLLADTVEFILPDGARMYGDKKRCGKM